jgi:hypothetical protein
MHEVRPARIVAHHPDVVQDASTHEAVIRDDRWWRMLVYGRDGVAGLLPLKLSGILVSPVEGG